MPSEIKEDIWIIEIQKNLDEEDEDDTQIPVNIFNVPKTLMAVDPDSYIPQQVSLGPYHSFQPELYDMERYKLSAAKRIQKNLHSITFEQIVGHFLDHEPRIRSCYHKYLNITGETLSWMMAIDSSFLLEFLQVYALKKGGLLQRSVTSRMSHLVDILGKKSNHNAILRDIMMLENQLPLFLLRNMLELQSSSSELVDDMLLSMLMGLCEEISPFKMKQKLPDFRVDTIDHVLGFLYHMIIPRLQLPDIIHEADEITVVNELGEEILAAPNFDKVKQFLEETWKILSKIFEEGQNKGGKGRLSSLMKALAKPIKFVSKLPWKNIYNLLPGVTILKQPLELNLGQNKDGDSSLKNNSIEKPPLVEEISIPSATKLSKAGVSFLPANGDISTILFDPKKFTLYLPIISLDINSEVVMRNLVAYESCSATGPLFFTRYTELMNGFIDTDEDAKLLREKGIINNRLKSDEEVANLWNGMNKSIRLTKVPFLDEVIEDVNKYYNGRWRVKCHKLMKSYVFESWHYLTLLAAIFLLVLTSLQAFCSVYTCSRIFPIDGVQ